MRQVTLHQNAELKALAFKVGVSWLQNLWQWHFQNASFRTIPISHRKSPALLPLFLCDSAATYSTGMWSSLWSHMTVWKLRSGSHHTSWPCLVELSVKQCGTKLHYRMPSSPHPSGNFHSPSHWTRVLVDSANQPITLFPELHHALAVRNAVQASPCSVTG